MRRRKFYKTDSNVCKYTLTVYTGAGILTSFPFVTGFRNHHFRSKIQFKAVSAQQLRTDWPTSQWAATRNLSPLRSSSVVFSVRLLATSTKICTMGSSTVSHENRFKAYTECKFTHTHKLSSYLFLYKDYFWNSQVSGNLTFTKFTNAWTITAWAPSVFGAVWFCRWVVTHSLRGFQLPWPPSCCLHHTEHPFAFIGRLKRIRLSPAYLENVRLNPSSPVLLTRIGPLRVVVTICYWFNKETIFRTDLKFERRPRSFSMTHRYLVSLLYPKWYTCMTNPSYPEGNFGGNQLLDGSMSLSPLYSSQAVTICTSVPHNASFHQDFSWLHHARA